MILPNTLDYYELVFKIWKKVNDIFAANFNGAENILLRKNESIKKNKMEDESAKNELSKKRCNYAFFLRSLIYLCHLS